MKKAHFILALFGIALFCSFYSQDKNEDSLLWEISGNGLKKPSYLYGTIHLMDERVFSFDSIVYDKMMACEAFSGELLFESVGSQFNPEDLFMDDTLLVDLYEDNADYLIVKKYLIDNLGIFSLACDSMKPIYTSTLVSMMDAKFEKSVPLDVHLQTYAKNRGKLILGIETVDEQMAALNSISLKDQAKMLLESIVMEDSIDSESLTEYIIDIYLKQDLVALDSIMDSGTSVDSFQKYVLENRNEVMAERIEKFIVAQSTFNTLGAGHLKGKNGVIYLLREKGYKLKPIAFSFTKK